MNLFGTGIRYWICEIPVPIYEQMNKIRVYQKVEWEHILFDFEFLNHFGYKHWSELSSKKEQTGLLLDPMNRIEIKQGSKILSRFRAIELTCEETLFPLYQTINTLLYIEPSQTTKRLVLIHLEKGLIGKFQFTTEQFQINHLTYELESLKDLQYLRNVSYQNQLLKKIKDDSLIVSSLVIEL